MLVENLAPIPFMWFEFLGYKLFLKKREQIVMGPNPHSGVHQKICPVMAEATLSSRTWLDSVFISTTLRLHSLVRDRNISTAIVLTSSVHLKFLQTVLDCHHLSVVDVLVSLRMWSGEFFSTHEGIVSRAKKAMHVVYSTFHLANKSLFFEVDFCTLNLWCNEYFILYFSGFISRDS